MLQCSPLITAILLVLLAVAAPRAGYAQLISPGKLIEAHSALEGITRCTNCHELGERGISNDKCLNCHEPLARRIRATKGFHATVSDRNCASCHKDHFGLDFDPIRFDTAAFDHRETGYPLVGSHRDVACRSCHRPASVADAGVRAFKAEHGALEETYLGLVAACASCHEADSPHRDQFEARACDDCHDAGQWDAVTAFDHDLTRFALTGRHRTVDCASCHEPVAGPGGEPFVRYAGVDFASCASCHEDVHDGRNGSACASCHGTQGWHRLDRATLERDFDHGATAFPLVGRHAEVACASCHGQPPRDDEAIGIIYQPQTRAFAYPHPQFDACADCHRDAHEGTLAGTPSGGGCDDCHTATGWFPTSYDVERHNREADFTLTGAHLATPCVACHRNAELGHGDASVFRFEDVDCAACHAPDDPHGGQFADEACDDCHTTDGWAVAPRFAHDATRFPLTGAHAAVDCAACHAAAPTADGGLVQRFRDTATTCAACHGDDDPHVGQFAGQACADCHDTASFHLAAFDHDRTRFPLDGAHDDVPCAACHLPETAPDGFTFTRFEPLGTACQDCH